MSDSRQGRHLAALQVQRFLALSLICPALAGLLFHAAASAQTPTAEGTPIHEVVLYQPPVHALVVDPFRPPPHVGAPGNRGLEYGTVGGEPVVAAAHGVVGFSGSVADRWFVSIDHADGLRTSYGALTAPTVQRGDVVMAGTGIGTATAGFHFGARIGDTYLNPAVLLQPVPTQRSSPRLVPVTLPEP